MMACYIFRSCLSWKKMQWKHRSDWMHFSCLGLYCIAGRSSDCGGVGDRGQDTGSTGCHDTAGSHWCRL